MESPRVEVGMRVRYPRTGTTGTVVALTVEGGQTFAELDSTHLRYRVDQLVPARSVEQEKGGAIEDAIEKIRKERDLYSVSGFQEAIARTDQSCEGGG